VSPAADTGPNAEMQEHRPATARTNATDSDFAADLVRNGSIELSITDADAVAEAADVLPIGMSVYVPSPPNRDLRSNLEYLEAIQAAGLNPVPHIAARKLRSRSELEEFLQHAVSRIGVRHAMLIGGDPTEAAGPFRDSAAVLREGLLSEAGIREISIGGYPEGHRSIPGDVLLADLEAKVQMAREQGLGVEVITQFCFSPGRITKYCAMLAQRVPGVPVYTGMAGPANPVKLVRYARYCGVSVSLMALGAMGLSAARLMTHTDPTEQLQALAHYCANRADGNVVGVHLFSFGGFADTARWMHRKCCAA